jgi:hypothetical protein
VIVEVTEDRGTIKVDANTLARRRAVRLREALVNRGVPIDKMSVEGWAGPRATVRVVITERDEVVPPVIPNGVAEPP